MLPYLKILFSLLSLNIVCFYSNSQEFKKELIPISFFTCNESYKDYPIKNVFTNKDIGGRSRYQRTCYDGVCYALVSDSAKKTGVAASPYKYPPIDGGIEILNGDGRFNRPLYSSVESQYRLVAQAGDRPEFMLMQLTGTKNALKLANLKLGVVGQPWLDQVTPVMARYDKGLQHYRVGEGTQEIELDVIRGLSFEGLLLRVKHQGNPLVVAVGGRGSANYDQNPDASAFNPRESVGTMLSFTDNTLALSGEGPTIFVASSVPLGFMAADPAAVGKGPEALLDGSVEGDAVGALTAEWPDDGEIYLILTTDKPDSESVKSFLGSPAKVFQSAIEENRARATMIEVKTPDPYLNAAVSACLLGYNATWNAPTFRHGPITWHDSYAGWRVSYGGTVAGWHDRVQSHMHAFFDRQHENGRIPALLGHDHIYNMGEVLVDQALYDYEWTGDLEPLRNGGFDAIARHLAWGEKYVKTPDGLYENFLNAWNTDYKWCNGGGGTIASTYYWRANRTMAGIAERLGQDPTIFKQRASEIAAAMKSRLWSERTGVYGEYRDRFGEELLHESPDLSSIYTPIDLGFSNPFESYRMLRFALRNFETIDGLALNGAIIYSSEWLPDHYSTRGLYTTEIINMLLAMYRIGDSASAEPFRLAMDGSFFAGPQPGATAYAMTKDGKASGHTDFTDTGSMYLQNVVNGLFGIQMLVPDKRVVLQPVFPHDWGHASIRIPAIEYRYLWDGKYERMVVKTERELSPTIRLRAKRSEVSGVTVNGKPAEYNVEPGIGHSWITVTAPLGKAAQVAIEYGGEELPTVHGPRDGAPGEAFSLGVDRGRIETVRMGSGEVNIAKIAADGKKCSLTLPDEDGVATFFMEVSHRDAHLWLPVEVDVGVSEVTGEKRASTDTLQLKAQIIDISQFYNQRLENLHQNSYEPRVEPFYWTTDRDEGLRTVKANGRSWWEGHGRDIQSDISQLKAAKGRFVTDNGIPFEVPAEGLDAVFTSKYDNFPDRVEIPVNARGKKLYFLLAASITKAQSRMENGRISVLYEDGTKQVLLLRDPETIDDWLGSGSGRPYLLPKDRVQPLGKNAHAVLQEIDMGEEKMIRSVLLETRTNETMIGLLGLTLMTDG